MSSLNSSVFTGQNGMKHSFTSTYHPLIKKWLSGEGATEGKNGIVKLEGSSASFKSDRACLTIIISVGVVYPRVSIMLLEEACDYTWCGFRSDSPY